MENLFQSRPARAAVFAKERMGKAALFEGAQMRVGLNAFEPGQEHAAHAHAGVDKLYCVLEGSGEFAVGDVRQRVAAGGAVFAPAGVPHGVRNESGERLVVLVAMAPPPR